jgi:predicted transcriptional regulator of viral defense system
VTRSRQDLRHLLEALAFSQAGYFTAAQALNVGYTYQAQKYHVDSGNWVRVDRGLFRLPSWPSAADDEYVLWTLWSRGLGVISHDTALSIHGLSDVDPSKIHLTVPPGFRAADPLVVTHPQELPERDIEQRRAWRVTTPLRTLADASDSDMSQEHVDQAVREALERGLATKQSILRHSAALSDRAALRLERALSTATENHGDI